MKSGAGAFSDFADIPAACLAYDPGLDLTNAEVGRDGKRLDFAHDPLWDGRTAEVFSACFDGPHACGDALADKQRLELGHGADDGEHRPAPGAVGIDLILAADEGEAVELPDQHAVDLAVPGGRHQGIELGAAL